MKKLLFILAIVFCLITSTKAQFIRNYGVKFGTTISSQNWDYLLVDANLELDSKITLNAGLFGEFLNCKTFSIISEINYCEKGVEKEMPVTTIENPTGTGETITWDASVKYINISLLAKARLQYTDVQPYVVLGPGVDFELEKTPELELIETQKTRFGLKIGLGSEFTSLLPFKFLAEVLYQIEFEKFYESQYLKITSRAVDLRIGIMF